MTVRTLAQTCNIAVALYCGEQQLWFSFACLLIGGLTMLAYVHGDA